MLTTLAELVAQLALSWLVQSSLFLLPACAALVVQRRLGPSLESLACRWILVGALMMPLVTVGMQAIGLRGWRITAHSANATADIEQSQPALLVRSAQAVSTLSLPDSKVKQSGSPQVPSRSFSDSSVAVSIDLWIIARLLISCSWFIITAILLTRLLRASRLIHLLRNAGHADIELQAHCVRLAQELDVRLPVVLRTDRVDSPCLVGVVRPAILIPDAHADSTDGWSQLLIHELAHVQRQDVLWNGLFRLSIALLPFQPLLWWLKRRHDMAAEQASDDWVVQHVDEPASYAQMLLELACRQRTHVPVAVGMIARPSILSQRIRRILDENCQHGLTASPFARLVVMSIVMLTCVGVGWCWLPAAISQAALVQERESPRSNSQSPEAGASKVKLTGRVLGVDEAAAAAAVVNLRLPFKHWERTLTTDAQGRFESELDIKPVQLQALRMKATSRDGTQMLLASVTDRVIQGNVANVELELQPTRTVQLTVLSTNDQPLTDAKVLLLVVPGYNTLQQSTGADGRATFKIPSQQVVDTVVAWKDGAGMDYTCFHLPEESASDPAAVAPTFPADGKLSMKLTGSRPLEIMVSDSQQQPITDVAFYPWVLNKPDQPELNVSMVQEHFLETPDANGRATLKWFPRWHDKPVSVLPVSDKYAHKQSVYDVRSDIPLRVQLDKLVAVAGRVILPDGRPAAGVVVRVANEVSGDGFFFPATTDSQGKYEFLLAPNFLYMLVIDDQQWAAQSHDVFMLSPDKPMLDRNIPLRRGTRVYGTLTSETDGAPVAGAQLQIYQMAPVEKVRALTSAKSNMPRHSPPMTTFTAVTDERGRYEIVLGNGQFNIRKPIGTRTHEFTIDDEPELQIDLTDTPSAAIAFRGSVVLAKSGAGVAKAVLMGEAAIERAFQWKATSDAHGRFTIERPPMPTYVMVMSADGSAGAMERLQPAQPSFDFKLQATGTVRGKLVNRSGQPLKKHKLNYSLLLPDEDPSTRLNRFQQTVETDAMGNFEIKSLLSGHEYTLSDGEVGSTVYFPSITKVTVEPGESVDLGNQVVPSGNN